MKYGLIGEHLTHSFSKPIHEKIGDYVYEIKEIEPQNLDSFMKSKEFLAINVTIPYKERVMPHLDVIDKSAMAIGAVNTVVNKNGMLYGYNTDYMGMKALVENMELDVSGKKVLIIGTGGTSKTATALFHDLGASSIIYMSSSGAKGAYSRDEIYKNHRDVEIIINTSPVGMYPNIYASPIDIDGFDRLCGVVDAVYNPIQTEFVLKAKSKGIKAQGGLFMLVAQAVFASEHFTGRFITRETILKTYNEIMLEKSNIVLVGMPSCGKSSVGKILAQKTGKRFVDTDSLIVEKIQMEISKYFSKYGDGKFREVESQVIKEIAPVGGLVIATGGGAVLNEGNVKALKQNGIVFFIDRAIELLIPTDDRPLSRDIQAIRRLYNERYPIYRGCMDVYIDGNGAVDEVANKIYGELLK